MNIIRHVESSYKVCRGTLLDNSRHIYIYERLTVIRRSKEGLINTTGVLVPNLPVMMMWCWREDWELKHLLQTQNGHGIYQSFLGFPDPCLLFIHVCVPRVVQKSASTNVVRGLYMIEAASRKIMVSNTKNIEVCDFHVRRRWGTYKCTLYTNLPLEGKAGSFNAT